MAIELIPAHRVVTSGGQHLCMQVTIDLWLWRVIDPVSRRNYITRYRMAEPDALDLDPAAERIEGSLERRTLWIDPNVADWKISPTPMGQANRDGREPRP